MAWSYKYIDHTADIAVELEADSLDELFLAAALAWRESISNEKFEEPGYEKIIYLEECNLEILLVSFLSELNYLFQNKKWILTSIAKIVVEKNDEIWRLAALISGFTFDPSKVKLKAEIKAVTYHQMEIKEANGKFLTRVVFDI